MTPHLSNLSSIDSLTNGAAENRRITRKLRLETMVFPECAGLKCGRRHDLCEHTSLAICFQLEVLQSGTILIKAPLAGIVATHSRENVALVLSLLPARYMCWLIQIPSCRHDARCGCTFRTSAARPRAQPGLRRERLQSSSSLQRALSYACLWCPISDRASRVAQNSWLRLVVEQLGVQNLVIIDFEWNQQVTGWPASGRRPLSIVSASKVAFSDNFWALSDFQAASASPCQPDFRTNLAFRVQPGREARFFICGTTSAFPTVS